jgi:hypothetical protein
MINEKRAWEVGNKREMNFKGKKVNVEVRETKVEGGTIIVSEIMTTIIEKEKEVVSNG